MIHDRKTLAAILILLVDLVALILCLRISVVDSNLQKSNFQKPFHINRILIYYPMILLLLIFLFYCIYSFIYFFIY